MGTYHRPTYSKKSLMCGSAWLCSFLPFVQEGQLQAQQRVQDIANLGNGKAGQRRLPGAQPERSARRGPYPRRQALCKGPGRRAQLHCLHPCLPRLHLGLNNSLYRVTERVCVPFVTKCNRALVIKIVSISKELGQRLALGCHHCKCLLLYFDS